MGFIHPWGCNPALLPLAPRMLVGHFPAQTAGRLQTGEGSTWLRSEATTTATRPSGVRYTRAKIVKHPSSSIPRHFTPNASTFSAHTCRHLGVLQQRPPLLIQRRQDACNETAAIHTTAIQAGGKSFQLELSGVGAAAHVNHLMSTSKTSVKQAYNECTQREMHTQFRLRKWATFLHYAQI